MNGDRGRLDGNRWRSRRNGIVFALGSAASFALFAPLGKLLLGRLPALEAGGLGYLVCGVILVAFGGLPRSATHGGRGAFGGRLRRTDIPLMTASILTGGILAPSLLFAGLRLVPAHEATLLLNLEAVFVVVSGIVVAGERPGWRGTVGAIGIIVAGVAISSVHAGGGIGAQPAPAASATPAAYGAPAALEAGSAGTLGAILIAAACAGWAADSTICRWLSHRDPRQITMIKGLVAGTASLIIAAPGGLIWPEPMEWLGLAIVGAVCLALSIVLYLLSLRSLGIAFTGAFFALSTPIGFAISIALLGERPGILGVGALALSLAATLLLASDSPAATAGSRTSDGSAGSDRTKLDDSSPAR